MEKRRYLLGILATHPIQYAVPWYRALAKHPEIDLKVFYCHRPTPKGQARAGFGIPFEWDIPLLEGYDLRFLNNQAGRPDVSSFFGCNTPEVIQIIQKIPFDAFVVHGWYVKSFWQAMLACWRKKVPLFVRGDSIILSDHIWLKRTLKHALYRWFIPKFDGYLIVGERTKEYYLYYGADGRKMWFAPHAVDNAFFSSRSTTLRMQRERLRQEWGIPPEAIVALFAGKFIPKKRPQDFVRAIALAQKGVPQVFGLMVGDGPLRAPLQSHVKNHRVPVAFTGFLNQGEISKAYAASDVLVLPSSFGETWGLVVNEAMASGLPAIVSDRVGCAPDLIRPGQTGEVFPCGNVQDLAGILKALALNPERLREMGEKAFGHVAHYSVEEAVQGTLQAIRAVVDRGEDR